MRSQTKPAAMPRRGADGGADDLGGGCAAAVGLLALGEAIFIGRLLYLPEAVAPPAVPPAAAESAPRILPTTGLSAIDAKPPTFRRPSPRDLHESRRRGPGRARRDRLSAERWTPAVVAHRAARSGRRARARVERRRANRRGGRSARFEFVNSAIGYRTRRVVEIKAGQITSVTMTVPNGTLNINAVPWAGVWIDGNAFGDTPLGNLSIAPGEHDIVFRHPQLGERHEKAIVRADRPTRVTVNLQQP